ncbi:MAG: hypothetical protein QOD35_981, partial [Nocardioidaceae bacterium]|nr:hypothetical protein [Nocardioidaceae bacterium]
HAHGGKIVHAGFVDSPGPMAATLSLPDDPNEAQACLRIVDEWRAAQQSNL